MPLYSKVAEVGAWSEPSPGRNCFSCCFVGVSLLSPLLLLNLTGLNWGQLEIQKRHRIDRQTESGIRYVGRLGGDAQPSLLLFSVFIL
jgi:hypothetical protein